MLLLVGSGRALGTVWWLRPGEPLGVGRKGVPLLIERDHSVSRSHATVQTDASDPAAVGVTDHGSKFGVHINGRRCPAGAQATARVGDRVTFGAQDSTFELCRCPVSVCIANMHTDMGPLAESIRAAARALGVSVVPDPEQCTHLVVPRLAVTGKLVHALVLNRWVTSPAYLQAIESLPLAHRVDPPTAEAVGEFVRAMRFLPAPEPPEAPPDGPIDLGGISWAPDARRQRLFGAKMFVFADADQHARYRPLVEAAQGACAMLAGIDVLRQLQLGAAHEREAAARASADAMLALARDAAATLHLVQPPAQAAGPLVEDVARVLGTRPMSESEISLAVLFVSCEVHTNPALSKGGGTAAAPPAPEPGREPGPERGPRRKRARISSFWETAVADGAQDQPAAARQPEPGTATAAATAASTAAVPPAEAARPARRRRNVADLWSGDAEGTSSSAATSMDAPGSPRPEQQAEGRAAGHTQEAPAPAVTDQAPQGGPAVSPEGNGGPAVRTEVAPLVRSRPLRSAQCALSSGAEPNFKRFRKTIHPYQQ
ncbi:hypothetical protein H4R18_002270 [Coemansia javaensis]|uniref:FHA domain-containing protein n=1 Tax=Coemansia javaensis TaxID=2761396 RepID=A0A9W8HCN3_9FUNG|nr:hypothetical protein H4R18_002270 [Coemansia javaensis]